MTEPIIVTRRIAAPPAVVYAYLTDSEKWVKWQGVNATIEAKRGGTFALTMANGTRARGEFVELIPDHRVVFTWGWIDHPGVPPGSSTVEIDLVSEGEGTLLRLTHRGLPPEEVAIHTAGWNHYSARLAIVAEGREPGPDVLPG
jgi:uncharacterized protein YndB with AHSA1/START domain